MVPITSGVRPGQRLLGQASVYTVGTFIQLGSAGLVIPLVTRLLSSADYGQVALALVFQAFVQIVLALGLPAGITRLYFDGTTETGVLRARRLAAAALPIGLLVAAGFVVSIPLWGHPVLGAQTDFLYLGVALALPTAVLSSTQAVLRAQERARSFVAVALTASAGAQAVGLGALLLSATPVSYLTGLLVGLVLASVVGYVLAGAGVSLPSRTSLAEALQIGVPTIPHALSIVGVALADRIVIQVAMGSAAVGRYQVAYALGGIASTMLGAVQNAWGPITFGAAPEERWSGLASNSLLIVRLSALAAAILSLLAPLGLVILAPASYDPKALTPVASVIALAALPWAVYLGMVQVLFWEKATRPLLWIGPAAFGVNVLLAVALVPWLGLMGAAVATVAALATQAVLVRSAARRLASIPWRRGATMAALAAGVLLVGMGAVLPVSTIGLAFRAALAGAAAMAGLRLVSGQFRPRGAV